MCLLDWTAARTEHSTSALSNGPLAHVTISVLNFVMFSILTKLGATLTDRTFTHFHSVWSAALADSLLERHNLRHCLRSTQMMQFNKIPRWFKYTQRLRSTVLETSNLDSFPSYWPKTALPRNAILWPAFSFLATKCKIKSSFLNKSLSKHLSSY